MARIFLTGGTGEIGQGILSYLAVSHRILALYRGKIIRSIPNVEWVKGDMLHPESYASILPKKGVVIHLAARTRNGPFSILKKQNVDATLDLIHQAREAGCSHAIVASTAAVTQEWLTPYARSKLLMETQLMREDFPLYILRPSLVYAKNSRTIENLKKLCRLPLPFIPLPYGGKAPIHPIHVQDMGKIVHALINDFPPKIEKVDAASPIPFTLRQAIETVARELQIKKPVWGYSCNWLGQTYNAFQGMGITLPSAMASFAAMRTGYKVNPLPVMKKYKLEFVSPENGLRECV